MYGECLHAEEWNQQHVGVSSRKNNHSPLTCLIRVRFDIKVSINTMSQIDLRLLQDALVAAWHLAGKPVTCCG